jgi:Flp pilus assembly protein TadG
MQNRLRKIRNGRRSRKLQWLNRFRRDERGIQLVELAIVIPIFLLLFAAVAEFGRYFYEYTTVAKAARVGARYLASAKVSSVEDARVKNLVVYGNLTGTGTPIISGLSTSNVVISREGGAPTVPETVTIQIVGFKHVPMFDIGKLTKSPSLSLNVDVKPSITMRYLWTQPLV